MIILFNERELSGISLDAPTQALYWVLSEAVLASNSPKLKRLLDMKANPELYAKRFGDSMNRIIWDPKTSKKVKKQIIHKAIYFQTVLQAGKKNDQLANQLSSIETSEIGKALGIWVPYITGQTSVKIESSQQKDVVLLLGKWLYAEKKFISAVVKAYVSLPERDNQQIRDTTHELIELMEQLGRWP